MSEQLDWETFELSEFFYRDVVRLIFQERRPVHLRTILGVLFSDRLSDRRRLPGYVFREVYGALEDMITVGTLAKDKDRTYSLTRAALETEIIEQAEIIVPGPPDPIADEEVALGSLSHMLREAGIHPAPPPPRRERHMPKQKIQGRGHHKKDSDY